MLTSHLTPINIDTLKGKFIVAHPNIKDNRFVKNIIYITEHNPKGAEGLVINKTSAYNFVSLLSSINNLKFDSVVIKDEVKHLPILRGGPVNNDKIFILHSSDYNNENTIEINRDVSYTKNIKILEDLINNKKPKQVSIFIGNCTWSPNQLDREIKNDTWLVYENNSDYVFNTNFDKLWENVYSSLGLTNTNSSYFYSNNVKILQ